MSDYEDDDLDFGGPDEVTQEELNDAVVEDTCHCCVCGGSFVLGGNDYVLLDGAEVHFRPGCSGAFCVECAEKVYRGYKELLDEVGEPE